MPLPWQHFILPLSKNACLARGTLRWLANICANISRGADSKTWLTVVRDARKCCPSIVCHNMPLQYCTYIFYHFQKMCIAHLHPKANICAKFHENWWITKEVCKQNKDFSHNFCHNMPLPWQHTNVPLVMYMLSCTYYTPRQTSVKKVSWELVKKWGSSSKSIRHFWKWRAPIYCHNLPLPYKILYFLVAIVNMFLSCTSTPQGKPMCQIS